MTKRYAHEMLGLVGRAWDRPEWQGVALGDVTRAALKAHLVGLAATGLSATTVNHCLAAVAGPLGYAFRAEILSENPAERIPRFSGPRRERGILSAEELSALFRWAWPDARGRVAFEIAATCGMRLGEICALRGMDVGEDRIFVRHGFNSHDGLKAPKNGRPREITLLPEIKAEVLALLGSSPHGAGPESFVFYTGSAEVPIKGEAIATQFVAALAGIGIDEATRRARGLSFHSLRHGFARAMSEQLASEVAMRSTGHSSLAMLQHYSDHKTEEDMAKISAAQETAFGKLLPFKRAAS